MNDHEYFNTQGQIMVLAKLTLDLNMDWFLNRIAAAEAIGPILNPTLYRAAGGNLDKIKRIAEAVRNLQRVASEVSGDG
jgi:hypothetical protein